MSPNRRTHPPHRPDFARALCAGVLVCLALSSGLVPRSVHADESPPAPEPEILDLTPPEPDEWSFRYVVAPIGALFRGRSHFYAAREIEIDTTPPGGYVDLFYVRAGFQKRFEQAEAPVRVILPSRLDAGPRDTLTIRAFAEGYQQRTRRIKVRSGVEKVMIDLSPLPNRLEAVGHRYFAGRSSLSFMTKEALAFRVQESDDGLSLILNETAMTKRARASVEEIHSPLIGESYAQQLGEDLLVKMVLTPEGSERSELRSRQDYDAPRELYAFVLELAPTDGGADVVRRAQAALAGLDASVIEGCRLAFDDALRRELDAGELARALVPRGSFVDPYVRASMRRLGDLSADGVVDFEDGTRYRPGVDIELEMALTQPGAARGFLALLDGFVAALEPEASREDALRGLLGPELPPAAFRAAVEAARTSEASCRSGA